MCSYDVLRATAIEAGLNLEMGKLQALIMQFPNEIKTPRRRECIRGIRDFIAFLQRCDALSEQNIIAFCAVADITRSRELQVAITNYDPSKIDISNQTTQMNRYALLRLGIEVNQPQSKESLEHKIDHSIATPINEVNLTAVNNLISKEIGNSWRRLGRDLGFNEAIMDEIEMKCPRDLSSRTMRILLMKQELHKEDLDQYVSIICQALVSCQRRDLRRKVHTMLITFDRNPINN